MCLPQGRYRVRVEAPGHKAQRRGIHLGAADYTAVFELDRIVILNLKGTTSATYRGERLSLNFNQAPLGTVLSAVSDFAKINIVASPGLDLSQLTLIRLRDVPWDEALERIVEASGLAVKRSGNVFTVYEPDIKP